SMFKDIPVNRLSHNVIKLLQEERTFNAVIGKVLKGDIIRVNEHKISNSQQSPEFTAHIYFWLASLNLDSPEIQENLYRNAAEHYIISLGNTTLSDAERDYLLERLYYAMVQSAISTQNALSAEQLQSVFQIGQPDNLQ